MITTGSSSGQLKSNSSEDMSCVVLCFATYRIISRPLDKVHMTLCGPEADRAKVIQCLALWFGAAVPGLGDAGGHPEMA